MHRRTGQEEGTLIETVIYLLLRDGDVSPGRFEDIFIQVNESREFLLSNGFLARYAKDIVVRLKGEVNSKLPHPEAIYGDDDGQSNGTV